MKVRFLKSVCAIAILFGSCYLLHAQQSGDVLSVDQAVNEAIAHNLDFFAQKYALSIAEAQIVTARLRPNPLLTLDADHLDFLGTGFSTGNRCAGPGTRWRRRRSGLRYTHPRSHIRVLVEA